MRSRVGRRVDENELGIYTLRCHSNLTSPAKSQGNGGGFRCGAGRGIDEFRFHRHSRNESEISCQLLVVRARSFVGRSGCEAERCDGEIWSLGTESMILPLGLRCRARSYCVQNLCNRYASVTPLGTGAWDGLTNGV